MKKLLLPALVAVGAGLAGGSAFSYKNAKEAAKVIAAHVADSLAKHATDSITVADSVAKETHARELAAEAEALLMTPADSIRLAQNQPTTLSAATHDLPNAVDPKHAAPAASKAAAAEAHAPAPLPTRGTLPKTAVAPKAGAKTTAVAPGSGPVATPDPKSPAALESALPERRIAKIFGAMQSKDAAKVLEQMSDNDVRVILGMMGDKQAAAILTALPAARAAAISKGEISKSVTAKDEKKPNGVHP